MAYMYIHFYRTNSLNGRNILQSVGQDTKWNYVVAVGYMDGCTTSKWNQLHEFYLSL